MKDYEDNLKRLDGFAVALDAVLVLRHGAVRRELPSQGAVRWRSAIVRAVFDAATDPAQAAAGVPDAQVHIERFSY